MALCDSAAPSLPLRHVSVAGDHVREWPNVEGALINHDAFLFRGRSVFRLRSELGRRLLGAIPTMMDVSQLVMCLPTRHGRFFPLVLDLPRNQQALHTVVVMAGSPAHAIMRYADVDAG